MKKRSPKADAELISIQIEEGIEVDYCPVTKGIWFDPGELNVLTNLEQDVPDLKQRLGQAVPTQFKSPVGGGTLHELQFHPDHDVKIDVDLKSGGIWLDKGELEKLVRISARLGDPKSKFLKAAKFFREKGYGPLQVPAAKKR